jgi:hypothetical protein
MDAGMGQITKIFKLTVATDNDQKFPCKKCSLETKHKVVACLEEKGSEDCGGGHSVDWYEDTK